MVSLTPGAARYKFRVLDLSKFAAALTLVIGLTRARGAPPRVEPLPSYGVSARGRPRSRLAKGGLGLAHARRGSVQISSLDLSKFAAALTLVIGLTRARGAPPRVEPLPSYGVSARGRPRSRLARGGLGLAHARRGSVQISSLDLSKFAAALTLVIGLTRARGAPPRVEPLPSYGVSARGRPRSRLARGVRSCSRQARLGTNFEFRFIEIRRRVNPSYWPYARARRAATGRAATELWGLCARPPAIEIGEGGLGLAHARRGSVQISSLDLSKFAAALTLVIGLTRARGAPPRVEPLPSYGVSARGRPRSRLARGGVWSRSRQARLGTNFEFRFIEIRRRVNPSYWPYARARRAATGRAATELWGLCARPLAIEIGEGGAWSRSLQARLGTNFELRIIGIRRRVNPSCWPYARARRAATGRAAAELWGLCARPPAIEIGEGGGLVSLTPGSARYKFRVIELSKFAPR